MIFELSSITQYLGCSGELPPFSSHCNFFFSLRLPGGICVSMKGTNLHQLHDLELAVCQESSLDYANL
jgi:hypothetical protein